ncbi:tRNA (adenosine(37)-N6)-dimethylallyltransferase MiaA [Kiloniella sp.]|uniref:tRNA (adenosine(37)-N6)-dimethylallyltransferase MiaA n=1 Tax=Kiloniella sp. TaxID=1938587 RepID=UPI003B019E46
MINDKPKVIVITGPTASGKSALGVDAALALGGEIINADSMQIYRELDVLTARPDKEDLAKVPHRLYGTMAGAERCSAEQWRILALEEIENVHRLGKIPILVGGTGLYIRALEKGIANIPDIPAEIRAQAQQLLEKVGGDSFKKELATIDPEMADRLHAGDRQRLIRAWEVITHTGKSLLVWQRQAQGMVPDFDFIRFAMIPPREELYDNCNKRFKNMLDLGALKEVEDLLDLGLDPSLPIMKALGVPELAEYLAKKVTLDDAISRAQQNTRRYAKRQMTWIRTQYNDAKIVNEKYSERLRGDFFNFIRQIDLTLLP